VRLFPLLVVLAPALARGDGGGGAPGTTAPTSIVCGSGAPGLPTGGGLRASHDVAVSGWLDGNGAGASATASVNLGATAWSDVGRCARAQELDLDVTIAPRWSTTTGAGAIDTAASLRYGPTPHADPDVGVLAWTLTSWELGYRGQVRAEPQLADRADLARDLFDRFTVTAGTRAFRVALADVCKPGDQRPECVRDRGPRQPTPMTLDLMAVDLAGGYTEQGQRRREGRIAGSLMRLEARELDRRPVDALFDFLRVEHEEVEVGGVTGTIDTVWPVYLRTTNPRTGTEYLIGWGEVVDFSVDDGSGAGPIGGTDPLEDLEIGGFGFTTGGASRGTGAGWNRTAYVTMAAEPVLEDRLVAEAWTPLGGVAARARVFAARLERLMPAAGQPPLTWTGGVAVGGTYRVAGLDVDVSAELGRSYYAALDGGSASAGFGARGLLAIHHAGEARWIR
jgi:hypothetical protein